MFCKYCGGQLQGTHCPACGKETVLTGRSTELERMMNPQAAPVKTYQEGLQEGYRNGLKKGYDKGYSEGASAAVVTPAAGNAPQKPAKRQKVLAVGVAAFLVGAILSGVIFSGVGYRRGENAGKAAGRKAAQEEAASSYLPLLKERYAQGLKDGKQAGYEQGVADAEARHAAGQNAPAVQNPANGGDDQEAGVLYSRKVNSGTKKEPSAEVKAIQERLIALTYLKDRADGVFGPKTESAVKDFQLANGLKETGEIDQETYDLLFSAEMDPVTPVMTDDVTTLQMILSTQSDLQV